MGFFDAEVEEPKVPQKQKEKEKKDMFAEDKEETFTENDKTCFDSLDK